MNNTYDVIIDYAGMQISCKTFMNIILLHTTKIKMSNLICLLNSFTDQREFVVKQNSSWISKTVCEEEKQN